MQNKPNFRKSQMNASSLLTKDYENKRLCRCVKTNPIQTQYKANTNPIPERPKMNENLFATKVYENITTFRLEQNKPNQTQPVVSLSNLFPHQKNPAATPFAAGLQKIYTQFHRFTQIPKTPFIAFGTLCRTPPQSCPASSCSS